jgi:uncharacterized OB-fold protein
MIKCLSCGYLHYEIQLNCPKCGSFYTEIIADAELTKVKSKTSSMIDKLKHTLEHIIPHGVSND